MNKKIHLLLFSSLMTALSFCAVNSQAGTSLMTLSPSKEVMFVPDQYLLGPYIGLGAGANVYQFSEGGRLKGPAGFDRSTDLKSNIGFAASLKYGYDFADWSFSDFGKKHYARDGVWFPAAELEFVYSGIPGSENEVGSNGLGIKSDLNTYSFLVNFLAKAQYGAWRPYFGVGVGGSLIDSSNTKLYSPSGNTAGDGNGNTDFGFAFQGLVGTDYFIDKNWSVYMEYKFLGIVDTESNAGGGYSAKNDIIANNIVMAGFKYHF